MIRIGLTVFCAAAIVAQAQAQTEPPDSQDSRYTFHRADDGYLRLDGRTGQVTLCKRQTAGWLCQAVPDDRIAFEAEIARLQIDNANLKRELLARNIPLPGGVRQEATGATPPDKQQVQVPEADFNKLVGFIENVWRRIVEMVASVQKEIMRRI